MKMNRHLSSGFAWLQSVLSLFRQIYEKVKSLPQKQGWFKVRYVLTHTHTLPRHTSLVLLFGIGIAVSIAIASCSPTKTANQPQVKLHLVSFSVTQAAHDKIIPKFVKKWQKEHNQTVVIEPSYGGSGSQTRAIIESGVEADVVHLSLAPDVQKLAQAGFIKSGWEQKFPHDSVVSKSVVVIVTREGNPKKIKTWADLANKGVSVVTPNPKTSGGARWNFLALWNAAFKASGNESQALEFVTKIYRNAPILPETAREATKAFVNGQGDVLLTYENEVILEELSGKKFPYIVPDVNFSIDNPVAIVDRNVDKHHTRAVAEAFIKYLYTPEAQREFVQIGYRPTSPNVLQDKTLINKYPVVKSLATAKNYGGWTNIQKQFFDERAIFDQVLSKR